MPIQVSPEIKEEINAKLELDITEAKQHYEENIQQKIINRYDMFYAEPEYYKKKFKNLSRHSSLVSSDIQDTIEWALPSIMKVFFNTENVISVTGVNEEDDANAEIMQQLLKYQLERKNRAFQVFYHWFKDALITGCGILKCYWNREIRQEEQTKILSVEALAELKGLPNIEITRAEEVSQDLFSVDYTLTHILVNQPKIENILASELLYSPRARNLDDAPFVAHRKRVTIDYLRRKELEGMYEPGTVDKVVAEGKDPQDTELETSLLSGLNSGYSPKPVDDARKEVELFECYTQLDINDDGLLENIIVTKVGDVILRIEENIYERHPFFILSPHKDPHMIMPKKSYAEMIGQLQDLKTALTKIIMINTAMANDPRMIMSEEAINIEDYTSGRSVIRKKAGFNMSDSIQVMPTTPLAPWTFNYLQYIDDQKADRTGVTKYTQGSDSSSLNKTATGISAIMQASNQRLEMICRMFMETGIQDLYRFLVELNQKFVDNNTIIRLTNKPLKITPDDLRGDFDLIVNSGVAMGTKEMTLMNIQTIITTMMQISATPVGQMVISPKNVYSILKKYLEELGYKNAEEFLTDPDVVMQQQQMQQQQAVAQLQQIFASLPPDVQKIIMDNGGVVPQEFLPQLPPQIQQLLAMTGGSIFGQPNNAGNPAGGESQNSQGVPGGVLQNSQGMGSQPTNGVQNGGYNPTQNYAPRS